MASLDSIMGKILEEQYDIADLQKKGLARVGGAAITLGGIVSGARATFGMTNPANSGMDCHIFAITLEGTVEQWFTIWEGADEPVDDASYTVLTPNNFHQGFSNASPFTMWHASVPPTGGTTWPSRIKQYTTSLAGRKLPPLTVPPGQKFAMSGSSSAEQTTNISAYYYQLPAA